MTKKNYYKIESSKSLSLARMPTRLKSLSSSKKDYKRLLRHNRQKLEECQTLLYANHKRSLLIIFQGMDTAGKDGAIKHVMSGVNPQGCSVVSFKTPSSNELDHDFLWRGNRALPARGQIGIFNRSYYEEILITRVHPKLLEKERLPDGPEKNKDFWKVRDQDIINYEKYLHRQGFDIIKVFIHISKGEQKKRLTARFKDPNKRWKISEGDVHERLFWNDYQKAYGKCIKNTVSKCSPWYIVPGDDKKNARIGISQILLDRFSYMELHYPKLKKEEKRDLAALRNQLAAEES